MGNILQLLCREEGKQKTTPWREQKGGVKVTEDRGRNVLCYEGEREDKHS